MLLLFVFAVFVNSFGKLVDWVEKVVVFAVPDYFEQIFDVTGTNWADATIIVSKAATTVILLTPIKVVLNQIWTVSIKRFMFIYLWSGLYQSEDDERYRYLLKKGIVRRVEDENKIIFAELPEIPGVLVIYRKPSERMANPDRLNLDKRELTHMPLLEGEERLRLLNLQHNHITQIENLVSLPNLIFLDLYNNQIKEISHL